MPDAPSTAARFSDKQSAIREILGGAVALIASEGYAALSLRALADRVGISVRTISHHLGDRAALNRALIDFARDRDLAAAEPWRLRAGLVGSRESGTRALLAEAALEDWAVGAPGEATLFCELLLRRPAETGANEAFSRWLEARAAFWNEIAGDPSAGELLGLYCLDELPYSLALGAAPAYRMLRRLCIARLLAGGFARGRQAKSEDALFRDLVAALAPEDSIVADEMTPRPRTRKDQIAAHAAAIMLSDGADHVTHRAVAAAAGVPSSTVVYQFGSHEDLVIAALESIIANFRSGISQAARANKPGGAIELYGDTARATIAIALGAARFSKLRPHAADMRRRRGENAKPDQLPGPLPPARAFDRLTAQILSMCLSGASLSAPAIPLNIRTLERIWGRLQHAAG